MLLCPTLTELPTSTSRTIALPQNGEKSASPNERTITTEAPEPNGFQVSDQVHNDISAPQNSGAPYSNPVESLTIPRARKSDYLTVRLSTAASLPLYIQALPATLGPEELVYLAWKDAFTLPSRHFLSVCLCRYIEFVHPVLPLLNLNDALVSIDDETGASGKISIILFLAIIYAALPFTEIEHVRAAGYSSKLEARTVFYKKVKVNSFPLRYCHGS